MKTVEILRNSRGANILKGIRNLVYRKTKHALSKMKIEKDNVSIGAGMTIVFSYVDNSYKYDDL